MAFQRGVDGSEPVRGEPIVRWSGAYEQRVARSWRLCTGTLACPLCDAPVALAVGRVSPADALGCPFCAHSGRVRDFLSLASPSRPARVAVRVVQRGRR